MEMTVISFVALLLSGGILAGGFLYAKKRITVGSTVDQDTLLDEVKAQDKALDALVSEKKLLYSRSAFDSLRAKVEEIRAQTESERGQLKSIEQKLETAQKTVETKEQSQQEAKAAKEEDLQKLQELLASYDASESASVELEQKLAASLKSIDSIMSEVALTVPQKEALQSLSNAVAESGARLRDLIMESQTVNERLQALEAQHQELESEYTRLVEQQLGE